MDLKHFAKASKDRTGLFMDKPEFIITPDTGKRILAWCSEGQVESENLKAIINHQPISLNHGSNNATYARQAAY